MNIGISRPPTPPYPIPDIDGAVVAQHAEALGFESVFYGEHPIRPVSDPGFSVHADGVPFFQDTLVMLARASAVTSRIKLGSGVFLIPEHNPILFAKQLASLDLYSGGRLIVGAGAGWSRLECELLGGNFDRRWAQTRESIELMKLLWRQATVQYEGEFFKVPPVQLFPKPASEFGPPVLLGVGVVRDPHLPQQRTSRLRKFRRIVSYADGWIPAFVGQESIENGYAVVREGRETLDELCRESGRDPAQVQITAILRLDQVDGDTTEREVVKRDVVLRYEDSGANRVAITMPVVRDEDETRQTLERIAEAVL